MPRFNGDDISERREASANARKVTVERFLAQPAEDDPAVTERKAARVTASREREARMAAREMARRAEAERHAAELKAGKEEETRLALETSERDAVERRAEADRAVDLLAGQKAARDSRYAARKARRR